MKITVDDAAPGSGKTFSQIQSMIAFPARYLFVAERVESLNTIVDQCRKSALARGRSIRIDSVRSGDVGTSNSTVNEGVERLPNYNRDDPHVIVAITHTALLMSDLGDFSGWHLMIDEVPTVLDSQPLQSLKDYAFFEEHYTLTPLDGYAEWSIIGLTPTGRKLTSRDLYHDDSHRHLRSFHNRVFESETSGRRRVVCNLTSWSQMGERVETKESGKGARPWMWGSLFTLNTVSAFATVTILANRFSDSLAYKLLDEAARADGLNVEWLPRTTKRPQTWERRRVRVHYFTNRNATRYHFESEDGRAHLAGIDAYLAERINPTGFIWATNDRFVSAFPTLPEDRRQQPKQAGSNEFTSCNEAAMFYSAKASPDLEGLLHTLKVTKEDWVKTNEYETILQFLTRTSIRNPASSQDLDFYVYDYAQARYVADQLATGSHIDLEIIRVDLGCTTEKKKLGRPVVTKTAEEIEALAARKRAQKAEWARKTRAAKGGAA